MCNLFTVTTTYCQQEWPTTSCSVRLSVQATSQRYIRLLTEIFYLVQNTYYSTYAFQIHILNKQGNLKILKAAQKHCVPFSLMTPSIEKCFAITEVTKEIEINLIVHITIVCPTIYSSEDKMAYKKSSSKTLSEIILFKCI